MKVKLDDVIEGMEFADMESEYYYHTKTEKVIVYMDEILTDIDSSELLADIEENWKDYIHLPTKYDIDEYHMMEKFIWELTSGAVQDKLEWVIRGKGAFRRFKDMIYNFGIEKDWFEFRDKEYKKIAIQWCEQHNIEYL